jgi:hypothetical protein
MNESGVWEIHFSWWTGWRLMVAGRVDGSSICLGPADGIDPTGLGQLGSTGHQGVPWTALSLFR